MEVIKNEYKTGKIQFIFYTNNKEIGELCIIPRTDSNFEISNVLVWPTFQRQGYATKFYKYVIAYVTKINGKLFISKNRTKDAKKLHSFFKSVGILNKSGQLVSTTCGVMWEFDHPRVLDMMEYKFYMNNPLPFGWSIISQPRTI